jgi:hypothetical protein
LGEDISVDDVMVSTNSPPGCRMSGRNAVERVTAFAQQFGETHLTLACHAAFPLTLTPDLLYRLWASFVPEAPWTAVADILLSPLCREISHELYEMDVAVRNLLLGELKEDVRFAQQRLNELASFLTDYVVQQLQGDDPDTRDLARMQRWTALAYTRPGEASRELVEVLSRLDHEDTAELLRMTSLVETFAVPLAEFAPLVAYARGMTNLAYGDLKAARMYFRKAAGEKRQIQVSGVTLPIPETIVSKIEQYPYSSLISRSPDVITGSIPAQMHNKLLIVCGGAGVGLLGQRRVLDVRAELQIDVTKELVPERGDTNSLRIALDKPVGTIPLLLLDMKNRVGRSITQPADIQHTDFLRRYLVVGGSLSEGVAASPAIAGGAIGHAANMNELRDRFSVKLHAMTRNIGPDNPLEVWIISSTAGGTGEGIHRAVAARLAEVVEEPYRAWLTLNFVRIGPATYRSIDARRTGLNTFFGVAADAAFAIKCREDFPGVTANWFYLELPDVGYGRRAQPVRAALVEMAVKTLMLDELAESLHILLINNGLRIVLTRIGYWGRDFEERVKYHGMLRQLVEKLRDLIEPNESKYVSGRPRPTFRPGPSLPQVLQDLQNEQDLLRKIWVEGWKFPKYSGRLSEDDRIRDWKRAINELIAPRVDNLAPEAAFEIAEPEAVRKEGESYRTILGVPEPTAGIYDEAWFDMITNAQRVKAWCAALLTSSGQQEGLRERLNRLARACSDVQYAFNPMKGRFARAREMTEYLADFVETLVQVVRLKGLERAADRVLQSQLANPKELLKEAESQLDIARSAAEGMGASPVIAGDLSDKLDHLQQQTWLRLLEQGFQQGGSDGFRQQVLGGAVGLTEAGLLNVLGLPENADCQLIHEALERVGRMYGEDWTDLEAQWWQGQGPPGVRLQYRFRVLPKLEPIVKARLGEGTGQIGYLYTELGEIALYVLAFEGVCIGNAFDAEATPAYLLRPFVPLVREALENWPKEPVVGRTHGQIEIASAGVVGDPLYEMALRDAGLTDVELEKIGQFYEFYNP